MKKRLLSMLCMAALLLCLLPQTAFAAGSLEGVDYDRITSATGGHQVIVKLGTLEFVGELTNGLVLPDAEKDGIIKGVMNEMHITSSMLINAKSLLEAAENIEGFGIKDVTNALLKLTGAQDAIDLYKLVMGENSTPAQIAGKIAQDQIKGEAQDFVQNQMEYVLTQGGKVALKGMGKYAFKLLFMLPDLTEIGLNALAKYENIKETCAIALERQLLLDTFYDECNKRIAEASGETGAWVIRFDKATATHQFNFWGIGGLMSEWTLSGELVKGIAGAGEGVAGNYEGFLSLDIKAIDMKNSFDKDFMLRTSAIPQITQMIKNNMSLGGGSYSEEAQHTTVLERTISGEFNLYLSGKKSGEDTPPIFGSFNGADTTNFSFSHKFTRGFGVYVGKIDWILETSMTSANVNTVKLEEKQTYGKDSYSGQDIVCGPEGLINFDWDMPIGTVWQPFDSEPTITIKYNN